MSGYIWYIITPPNMFIINRISVSWNLHQTKVSDLGFYDERLDKIRIYILDRSGAYGSSICPFIMHPLKARRVEALPR